MATDETVRLGDLGQRSSSRFRNEVKEVDGGPKPYSMDLLFGDASLTVFTDDKSEPKSDAPDSGFMSMAMASSTGCEWYVGSFGSCTSLCAAAYQYRLVVCMNSASFTQAHAYYCQGLLKPLYYGHCYYCPPIV